MNSLFLIRMLVGSAGLATTMLAPTASAQTVPPPAESGAETPGVEENAELNIGDIVVTAQRREERLRDVPISITALSGEALNKTGILSGTELGQITPGLNFQANGSTIQPAIRGVTSSGSSPGDAANVAIYVDGVYQPVQFSNFIDLVDIQRIEVLKGPQGTLFGRNATGGAINITTLSPQNDPTMLLRLSYGRFDDLNAQAFVAGPLTKSLSASFAANYRSDRGYRRDIVSGARLARSQIGSVRGKLKFEPGSAFDVVVSADYTDSKNNTTFAGQPLNGNTVAASLPGVVLALEPNTAALNFVPTNNTKGGGGSVRAVWHLPFADLSSLTAYRTYKSLQIPDSDVTNLPISASRLAYDTRTWSQEFNLASTGSAPLGYLFGIFLFDDRQELLLDSFTGAANTRVLRTDVDSARTRSAAAFGELNYAVTDRLSVIGGLRYSIDEIDFTAANNGAPYVSPPAKTYNSLTPRGSIRYAIAPDTNVYFTYSRGFKAGVFATTSPSATALPVRPEKISAYEIGVKGGSGPLSYSAAAFHYDYRDLQFQSFGATSVVAVLQNAATARINGAEFNLAVRPVAGLSLSAGASYIDGTYSSFPRAQGFVPRTTGGNAPIVANASGNKLIRTPDWSGNLSASYEAPVGASTLTFSGNAFFSGRVFYDVTNRTSQKPYEVVNLSVGWRLPGDHLELQVFGNNVTDTIYIQSLLVSALGDAVQYARPATYGARLNYRF